LFRFWDELALFKSIWITRMSEALMSSSVLSASIIIVLEHILGNPESRIAESFLLLLSYPFSLRIRNNNSSFSLSESRGIFGFIFIIPVFPSVEERSASYCLDPIIKRENAE
jgi:hypothetical protein